MFTQRNLRWLRLPWLMPVIALTALVLVAGSGPVHAQTSPITLMSGNGVVGGLDPLNQKSVDGGATFQPAFIVAPNIAWASPISGTNWIFCNSDPTNACGVGTPTTGKTTRYRAAFTLPAGYSAPSLSISLHADNSARVFVNGIQIGEQRCFGITDSACSTAFPGEGSFPNFGPGAPDTFSTSIPSLFNTGTNHVQIDVWDVGGISGLDYKATVSFTPAPPQASQASVDAIEAKLDARLDATVSSRASQASVNAVQTSVDTKASQASVDTLQGTANAIKTAVQALEAKLDARLDVTVSSRATQTSVDAVQTSVNTKASQASVDTLQGTANAIKTAVQALEAKLDARLDVTVSSRATQTSVNELSTKVTTETNQIDAALAAVEGKLDQMAIQNQNVNVFFQALVGSVLDLRKVEVQAFELKNKERFLLVTTESGQPVNATLVSVRASEGKKNQPVTWVNATFTATPVPNGMLDVKVTLPNGAKDAKMFEFKVEHDHGVVNPIGPVKHFGMSVVDHHGEGND